MSWRQPWDVVCPACLAGPGTLCRAVLHHRPIETLTAKKIATLKKQGRVIAVMPHEGRWQSSLRGKKVPLA